ncbi:MAG: site-specific tyrosine recombinase XerC [candidate division BRC1 bacterium ADurb.BinA292]|nr:MAG: site-specific tyrosine recombinase XerC [candidate division BRC1 bacterium ADurb.BinA292]
MRVKVADAQAKGEAAILTAKQIRGLLGWLKENRPMVYLWGLLQGAAGLRNYEAIYLTEADLDYEHRTIRVTSNAAHRVKTAASNRTLPVAEAILKALAEWTAGLKVRSLDGFIFKTRYGRHYKPRTVVEMWQEALGAARVAGVDLPEGFIARRMRASFVTAMREGGADFAVLQRYIGHRPDTTMTMHYERIGVERLKAVATLAEQLIAGAGAYAEPEKKDAINGGVLH